MGLVFVHANNRNELPDIQKLIFLANHGIRISIPVSYWSSVCLSKRLTIYLFVFSVCLFFALGFLNLWEL